MKYLLKHAHLVVDGNREFLDGSLLIEDDVIKDVLAQSNKLDDYDDYEVIDLNGSLVMPGFFDTHLHGIKGISFDTANKKELDEATYLLAISGTTSFIPSLSYDCDTADFPKRFELFNDYKGEYCRFEGLHIEGPFISANS